MYERIKLPVIWMILLSAVFVLPSACHAEVVVDFEGFQLGSDEFFNGPVEESVSSGLEEVGTIEIDGVGFINRFNSTRKSWSGFSISNRTDTTTPGFTNEYSAITGGGSGGAGNTVPGETYAMAFGDGAYFNLPELMRVESTRVTNSTYAALSMRDGDDFGHPEFGGDNGNKPDYFSVTFHGWSNVNRGGSLTGEVEYFLADFRDGKGVIVDSWEHLDLSALGAARSIGLQFDSTAVNANGVITPKYVAIDNLRITAVPEPGAVLALGVVAGGLMWRLRRRRLASKSPEFS